MQVQWNNKQIKEKLPEKSKGNQKKKHIPYYY